MVQQLSLVSSFTPYQEQITIETLVALTGMNPQPYFIHTLVFSFSDPSVDSQTTGQRRIHLTSTSGITSIDNNETQIITKSYKDSQNSIVDRSWCLSISDIPLAGKRKVSSQSIFESSIDQGNAFNYIKSLSFKFSFEYWNKGIRFYHGSTIIEIFKLYKYFGKHIKNDGSDTDMIIDKDENNTTNLSEVRLVDPARTFFVKAYVNVEKITDLDSIAKGTNELEKLRYELIELFQLQIPDRNAMQ